MNRVDQYIYNYSFREEELPICRLEMRSLFGFDSSTSILESSLKIDPSRSPFIKERIEVIYEGESVEALASMVGNLQLENKSFKVIFVQNPEMKHEKKINFEERRRIERFIGVRIQGLANLVNPERLFAIMHLNGRWVFGDYIESESVWFVHQQKPKGYSTALSTRLARAVVNISVPDPTNIEVIDPCCGIGTVLIEASSMGINIVGSDINPLALIGARENLEHFGLNVEVTKRDIRDVRDHYDVAIIDMPYNLCSVITAKEQLEMLQNARRFANKVVVITVEAIDSILQRAGFKIQDRCQHKKGNFARQVLVCE